MKLFVKMFALRKLESQQQCSYCLKKIVYFFKEANENGLQCSIFWYIKGNTCSQESLLSFPSHPPMRKRPHIRRKFFASFALKALHFLDRGERTLLVRNSPLLFFFNKKLLNPFKHFAKNSQTRLNWILHTSVIIST